MGDKGISPKNVVTPATSNHSTFFPGSFREAVNLHCLAAQDDLTQKGYDLKAVVKELISRYDISESTGRKPLAYQEKRNHYISCRSDGDKLIWDIGVEDLPVFGGNDGTTFTFTVDQGTGEILSVSSVLPNGTKVDRTQSITLAVYETLTSRLKQLK